MVVVDEGVGMGCCRLMMVMMMDHVSMPMPTSTIRSVYWDWDRDWD